MLVSLFLFFLDVNGSADSGNTCRWEGGGVPTAAGRVEQATASDHVSRRGALPAGVHPAWSGNQRGAEKVWCRTARARSRLSVREENKRVVDWGREGAGVFHFFFLPGHMRCHAMPWPPEAFLVWMGGGGSVSTISLLDSQFSK